MNDLQVCLSFRVAFRVIVVVVIAIDAAVVVVVVSSPYSKSRVCVRSQPSWLPHRLFSLLRSLVGCIWEEGALIGSLKNSRGYS